VLEKLNDLNGVTPCHAVFGGGITRKPLIGLGNRGLSCVSWFEPLHARARAPAREKSMTGMTEGENLSRSEGSLSCGRQAGHDRHDAVEIAGFSA
jgi:hypothetical protein